MVGKWLMMEWVQSVIFQMIVAKKRKAADENHVFQSKETGKYFFCLKDIIVLFTMGKLLFQKKYNSRRHNVISPVSELSSLQGQ